MSHPILLALFEDTTSAAAGARGVHALGIDREHLSVVARTDEDEGRLARALDGTPGAEIDESRLAGRLGELGGRILAAVALVLPGVGPIIAAGPLGAELSQVAGHAAGDVSSVLERAGVPAERAQALESAVDRGHILLGVHTDARRIDAVRAALEQSGASTIDAARWP